MSFSSSVLSENAKFNSAMQQALHAHMTAFGYTAEWLELCKTAIVTAWRIEGSPPGEQTITVEFSRKTGISHYLEKYIIFAEGKTEWETRQAVAIKSLEILTQSISLDQITEFMDQIDGISVRITYRMESDHSFTCFILVDSNNFSARGNTVQEAFDNTAKIVGSSRCVIL